MFLEIPWEDQRENVGKVGNVQGDFFNWSPPKFSKYKIPVYALALWEFSEQLTWDFVFWKFSGGPVERSTQYQHTRIVVYFVSTISSWILMLFRVLVWTPVWRLGFGLCLALADGQSQPSAASWQLTDDHRLARGLGRWWILIALLHLSFSEGGRTVITVIVQSFVYLWRLRVYCLAVEICMRHLGIHKWHVSQGPSWRHFNLGSRSVCTVNQRAPFSVPITSC